MAKKRVYEIAREKGLTSHELLERLHQAGLEIKSSVSGVDEEEVERVLAQGSAVASPGAKPAGLESEAKPVAESVTAGPAAADTGTSRKQPAAEGKTAEDGEAPGAHSRQAPTKESRGSSEGRAPQARAPGSVPQGAQQAARPTEGRAAGRGPAARKGQRGKTRGVRLEDLPTVVGPGVPMRKGATPSSNVITKEELARMQAEKAAQAEAAKKAAAPEKVAAAEKPAAHKKSAADKRAAVEKKSVADKPAPGERSVLSSGAHDNVPPSSPRTSAGTKERGRGAAVSREAPEKRPNRPRIASIPIPEIWAEAAEATGLISPVRTTGGYRVRRGEEKSSKRRVIIDSQAGRKSGKTAAGRAGTTAEAEKPAAKKKAPPGVESPVTVKSGASVKDLSEALQISAGDLIKTLIKLGEMVTITQSLSDEAILVLAEEFGRQVQIEHAEEEREGPDTFVDDPADLVPRPPVVTIMGHVDHGKTSLLDAIRETEVAKNEAGGITQHIGAYQVTHNDKKVTFLDTPGHEAFTAMRARGAKVTDIAVIVVAANDGVMPQTLEAISHARAADVPIVVAINKIDLPDANPDRVKKQLADQGLVPEEWGGDTVVVEVSAKRRLNLGELMEMILLVAEMQELKANPSAPASGVVIEAQLDVGRGPVATVLVQRGTLRVGDAMVCGEAYGKVKAMFDFMGNAVREATPSMPVQVLGFNTVPQAGDFVMVVKDEREARQRAERRAARLRQEQLAKSRSGATTLEEFYRRLKEGRVKELPIIIKADVVGSVEALEEALRNISHPEAKVEIVHAGVGGINESDIMLASASKAVVIGFNVRPSAAAKALAEQERVDVRTYRVIYKAIEDVEAALLGLLGPEQVEEEIGTAEVRKVFYASKVGTIAGCYVQTGKLTRSAKVRVVRDGSIVWEGGIDSLKRFADDVREVAAGYECGLHLDGFDDVREGDIIEAYEIKEVART